GNYLAFPKITDAKYRGLPPGQGGLRRAAIGRLNSDLDDHPFGDAPMPKPSTADEKWIDPGKDDDWVKDAGRPVCVPVDTTIDIKLASKDVIHDFYSPQFRVKLDAVPGMIGHIFFKPTLESQSTKATELSQIALG